MSLCFRPVTGWWRWARVMSLVGALTGGSAARGADPAVVFRAADGAPYAGSATVSGYATKVFLSGVSASDPAAALASLDPALRAAGVGRADVVNVRASLLPPADAAPGTPLGMEAWNTAWNAFFADPARRPTRTTLAASHLAGSATITVEAVAAALPAEGAPLPGRPSLNPFVRTVGDGPYGASAAALVAPGSAILFSAGVLADPADLTQPERTPERFGSMAVQTRSVLRKLEASLLARGFVWEDVFYVRALLSPPLPPKAAPGAPAPATPPPAATVDFAGFGEAFTAAFPGRHPALRPALTVWAAPGFNPNGTLVEIEVYAAAADARGPFTGIDVSAPAAAGTPAANPWLAMAGNPEAQISSSGVAARWRPLTWYAGVINSTGPAADLHDDATLTLLALRGRLAAAGATFGDCVQLRAYPVVGDAFTKNFALWNEAYARFFNHARLNPHKPARTAFPVGALPRGALLELEVITVGR